MRQHELVEAVERTLLAWLRTVIALLAIGCAMLLLGEYLERDGRGYSGQASTRCSAAAILLVATLAGLLGLDDYRRRRAGEHARSRAIGSLAVLVGIMGASQLILMVLWR